MSFSRESKSKQHKNFDIKTNEISNPHKENIKRRGRRINKYGKWQHTSIGEACRRPLKTKLIFCSLYLLLLCSWSIKVEVEWSFCVSAAVKLDVKIAEFDINSIKTQKTNISLLIYNCVASTASRWKLKNPSSLLHRHSEVPADKTAAALRKNRSRCGFNLGFNLTKDRWIGESPVWLSDCWFTNSRGALSREIGED